MRLRRLLITFILSTVLLSGHIYQTSSNESAGSEDKPISKIMPDLSGLAWIEGDTFLAVHDAKNPEENELARVSIVRLPQSLGGVSWKHIELDWPSPLGLSCDLESVARVPGTNRFLLVESGEGILAGRQFRRVFQVEVKGEQLEMHSFTDLPDGVQNIEGAAVARLADRFVFIFAERAEGQPGTNISWAELQFNPLRIGAIKQVMFRPNHFTGRFIRPVSAIEVDSQARLYIASAFDPGDDNGPFHSVIKRIGQVKLIASGGFKVVIDLKPKLLATMDGFKIESLAVRERERDKVELFAGTDDENYGGTLRLITLQNN